MEVIECSKEINLLGNIYAQGSELVSPTQLFLGNDLGFWEWEVECYKKKVSFVKEGF